MGAEGLPAPRAEGSLQQRPFAHLLVYINQQELTGTLVVWPEQGEGAPAGQDRILFQGGIALAGRLLSPASALDRGMLPLFTRVDAPYAFYEANLLGKSREGIVPGRVDPVALITASLRGSARQDAIDSVLSRFGDAKLRLTPRVDLARFGFDPKEMGFVELIRAEPAPVEELVRSWGDERTGRRLLYALAIHRCVEPFEGRSKVPSRERIERLTRGSQSGTRRASRDGRPSSRAERTPSQPAEQKAPAPPAQPVTAGNEGNDQADDFFDEVPPERFSDPPASMSTPASTSAPARPAAGTKDGSASGSPPRRRRRSSDEKPQAPPDPPPGLSTEHATLWEEIRERSAKLDEMTYYAMLGVSKSAPPSAVRDAYFAIAKKWHPDRLPSELEPLRQWVDRIFHHATKARDTLSDEEQRAEYIKTVQEGGGTPAAERQLNAIITAAMAVQRVEVLVRRRDWLEALQTLNEALELNPEDSDAHAMQAWVLFQRSPDDAPYSRIHAALDRALELNPRNAKALHHKGVVLKRQGRHDEAITQFRKCAEIDPKNIDAAREVRLANMRRQKGGKGGQKGVKDGKETSGGGVLSKLFGKK